jgi:hypothetical protein
VISRRSLFKAAAGLGALLGLRGRAPAGEVPLEELQEVASSMDLARLVPSRLEGGPGDGVRAWALGDDELWVLRHEGSVVVSGDRGAFEDGYGPTRYVWVRTDPDGVRVFVPEQPPKRDWNCMDDFAEFLEQERPRLPGFQRPRERG